MIVIVDYNIGNVSSIKNMLHSFGCNAVISRKQSDLESCEKIILPGVGAFDSGMKNLKNFGLIDLLSSLVVDGKKPFLGICLGMQLLAKHSDEGTLPGLGWIDASVREFTQSDASNGDLRIPHMGWESVTWVTNSALSTGIEDKNRFYFVHSYFMECKNRDDTLGTANYGRTFTAVVKQDNIYGVQFHPEKSHRFGKQLLKNFVSLAD